jgi:hypothetical protein
MIFDKQKLLARKKKFTCSSICESYYVIANQGLFSVGKEYWQVFGILEIRVETPLEILFKKTCKFIQNL